MVEASTSTTPVDKRRRKRRNKIELEPGPPVEADPYEGQPISVEDDVEEISVAFLAQLNAADDAKQRRDRRQQLLQEAEAEDSEEHLMREFAKAKPTERQLLWEKVKQEQAALLTQVKEEYQTSKSSKDAAKGDLRRHPRYTGENVVLRAQRTDLTPYSST